jgi:hypothetical protein
MFMGSMNRPKAISHIAGASPKSISQRGIPLVSGSVGVSAVMFALNSKK